MFGEAVSWVVAQLAAAGISAAADPADLNTPGVWVLPDTSTASTLDDQLHEVTILLYLIVGSLPATDALAALDGLLAGVRAAIRVRSVQAVTVALPNHNPAGLPAYRATINLDIKE
ncbi:MAG: hypothetical protein QM708_07225 [Propioniciclava sp.]|uniref:hypothetical protein n=1 Tax=Propioniciclava sp. TaxID=2038686 RepID=UPI0039E28D48